MSETASSPKQRSAAMRRRLSDAALTLYCEGGAKAVTFRRLAAALDISHMLPYRYFANKEELLAQVREDCFHRLGAHIRASDPRDQAPLPRLQQITLKLFAYLAARPAEYRLMFSLTQPPINDYPGLAKIRIEIYDYLLAIVQQGIDAGVIQGDAHTRMHLAWATAHGLFTLHLSGQLIHTRDLNSLLQPALASIFSPYPAGATAGASDLETQR